MEILKLCALALICAVCCLILNKTEQGFSQICGILGTVLIFTAATSGLLKVVDFSTELSSRVGGADTLSSVLKACSVMLVTEVSADICERAGETTLSKALIFAGKTEIILIALPLFRRLLDTALKLCGV